MEVELLHRNDLAISAAGRAAFDAERGPLAGLTDAGENLLAQVRSNGLAQAHGGSGLPFAERRGGDGCNHDVFAVGGILQAISDGEMHLGFALSIKLQFVGQDAYFGGNFVDWDRRGGLRNVEIAWDACKYILQLMRHSLSLSIFW